MAAFKPGQSPPAVRIPMRLILFMRAAASAKLRSGTLAAQAEFARDLQEGQRQPRDSQGLTQVPDRPLMSAWLEAPPSHHESPEISTRTRHRRIAARTHWPHA